MFAHIEGRVAEKRAGELVIDAGGVGFLLACSHATVAAAPAMGERFRVYTHLSVREDGMELFGFSTREEREMFRRLCAVSGVGPRTALGILSTLSLRELSLALLTGDANAIARAPNVGKKTAQRLILELKDKVEQADVEEGVGPAILPANAQRGAGGRAGADGAGLFESGGEPRGQRGARPGGSGRCAGSAGAEGIGRLIAHGRKQAGHVGISRGGRNGALAAAPHAGRIRRPGIRQTESAHFHGSGAAAARRAGPSAALRPSGPWKDHAGGHHRRRDGPEHPASRPAPPSNAPATLRPS